MLFRTSMYVYVFMLVCVYIYCMYVFVKHFSAKPVCFLKYYINEINLKLGLSQLDFIFVVLAIISNKYLLRSGNIAASIQ